MKKNDEYWMKRCLRLAVRAAGNTSPNPMVGAVITKNGAFLSAGYHKQYGQSHAEINAIDRVRNKILLRGSTLYVNLEPCCHYGNTPPCVNEILKHGFARVVIATKDRNVLVNGKSIRTLRRHGIRCNVGVSADEARRINEQYFHFIATGMPFVAIKAAQTKDGFIASVSDAPKWISNSQSRTYVHVLRSHYDAILVGAGTVKIDDPRLTVRNVKGRNPIRIIVDGSLTAPISSRIFNDAAPTVVYTSKSSAQDKWKKVRILEKKNIAVVPMRSVNNTLNIRDIVRDLARHKISSLLVEGGQEMYAEFLDKGLVNKMYLFTSPTTFRSGISLFGKIRKPFAAQIRNKKQFGNDIMEELYF
jgi:diaminohydroxyphosphoribosylaminopyrimidine deaminase/5-amino-6-(5-phosphoribosylamino)uracil reductase